MSMTPTRKILPPEREGKTKKVTMGGIDYFLHTGEYPDGTLGEIRITNGSSREGDQIHGLCQTISQAVSIGLQYGVPLSEFTRSFRYMRFEPAGVTGDVEHIETDAVSTDRNFWAKSFVDWMAWWLDREYVEK
jgi:hypothetical protein